MIRCVRTVQVKAQTFPVQYRQLAIIEPVHGTR